MGGRIALEEVIRVIETTPIPAGVNPIGTEWVISQVRKTLSTAVREIGK